MCFQATKAKTFSLSGQLQRRGTRKGSEQDVRSTAYMASSSLPSTSSGQELNMKSIVTHTQMAFVGNNNNNNNNLHQSAGGEPEMKFLDTHQLKIKFIGTSQTIDVCRLLTTTSLRQEVANPEINCSTHNQYLSTFKLLNYKLIFSWMETCQLQWIPPNSGQILNSCVRKGALIRLQILKCVLCNL